MVNDNFALGTLTAAILFLSLCLQGFLCVSTGIQAIRKPGLWLGFVPLLACVAIPVVFLCFPTYCAILPRLQGDMVLLLLPVLLLFLFAKCPGITRRNLRMSYLCQATNLIAFHCAYLIDKH